MLVNQFTHQNSAKVHSATATGRPNGTGRLSVENTASQGLSTPSDAFSLSEQFIPDQKPEFKALVSDGIKALPKHLLKQAVGLACMPLGVLAGALYSGTLVGPIIVGAGNHDKQRQDPSLEQTVQRGQMPLVGDLAMGSADMVADGAGLIASVAKEMAAPVTWAVDSYKFGYNLIK